MRFCERLKKYRLEQKLTQQELAQRAGISTRMLQKYESGSSMPRMTSIEAIADALNIPATSLLEREEVAAAQISEEFGPRAGMNFLDQAKEFSAMMAGGSVPKEDVEAAFKMITLAYAEASRIQKQKTTQRRAGNKKN